MKIGSLFSGGGGLDLAVEAVFGGELAWCSEIDESASKVLAHRWPDAPNFGDITAVNWNAVEPVDVLCGGFPCQDVSLAGQRAGLHGESRSGLWAEMARIIGLLSPRWVVIENVKGLLSATAHRDLEPSERTLGDGPDRPLLRALGAVLGDLASLGYDAQWTTLPAAAVGAPHRRERVFILASHPAERGRATRLSESSGSVRESFAAVSGDEPLTLLPTPSAGNFNDGEDLDSWESRREAQKDRGINGNGMGMPLGIAVQLLPTPVTTDAKSAGRHSTETGVMHSGTSLTDAVRLLPTPDVGDARRGSSTNPDSYRPSGAYRQISLVDAAERELLPTPTTSDGDGGKINRSGDRSGELLLGGIAKAVEKGELLPTPMSRDSKGRTALSREGGPGLLDALALMPTPAAADADRGADFARATRPGAGADDLITFAVKTERDSQWGRYSDAISRWEEIVGPAPSPTEPNKNGRPRLAAPFSEWMMGWPAGWVTAPEIGLTRSQQLRIIGNGVVPQQAFAALEFLLAVEGI